MRCRSAPTAPAATSPATPRQLSDGDGGEVCAYPRFRETLPGGRSYDVLDQLTDSDGDNFGPIHGARGPVVRDGRQSRRQPRQPLHRRRAAASACCRSTICSARSSSPSGRPTARPSGSSPGPGSRPRAGAGSADRLMATLADWLEAKTGHRPADLALFERALTHSSRSEENYERLEFLGDRVLGLVIADWLYDLFPDEPEGKLSQAAQRPRLARAPAPRSPASSSSASQMRLGKQARDDGAFESDNVLGDMVEALIGALWLDAGLRGGEGLHPRRLGATASTAATTRPSIPNRRFRNGRRRTTASRRSTRWSAAPARSMRRPSSCGSRSRASARPRRRASPSRRPRPRRRRRCWTS